MTDSKKTAKLSTIIKSVSGSSFHIEIKKSSRGAGAVICGVMSIGEYNENTVELLSHSGRMIVSGEFLYVSLLQERVVEIFGKITEVKLSYGKA